MKRLSRAIILTPHCRGRRARRHTAHLLVLLGRIFIGWIFVRSGYGKIFDIPAYEATFPYAAAHIYGLHRRTGISFGGLALMLGFATRYAALIMGIFLLVATFSSHRYWDFTDAAARRAQDSNFYKNVAILGGVFPLFACGAGRFSLDNWLRKQR